MFIFFPSATLITLAAKPRWEGMVINHIVYLYVCVCMCVCLYVCLQTIGKTTDIDFVGIQVTSAMIISDYKAIIGVIIKHGIKRYNYKAEGPVLNS